MIRQGRRDLMINRLTPDLLYDQMIAAGCCKRPDDGNEALSGHEAQVPLAIEAAAGFAERVRDKPLETG